MLKSDYLRKFIGSSMKSMFSFLQALFDYNKQKLKENIVIMVFITRRKQFQVFAPFEQHDAESLLFDKWQQARQENVSIASSKSFYCQQDNEHITFLSS